MRTPNLTALLVALPCLLWSACGGVEPMPTPVEPIRTDNVMAPSFEHRVEPPPAWGPDTEAPAEAGDAGAGSATDAGASAPGRGDARPRSRGQQPPVREGS